MHGHLVTVKVRVECGADQRMNLDGLAFDQDRLKGLDAEAVQGGGTVQQHRAFLDDFLKDFPHLGFFHLDGALGALDIVGVAVLHQLTDDERPEQLQGHGLGQTALVELQLRADHDHGTAGVVHTLAQQIAAETPLLAFEHVAQALELAPSAAAEGLPALAVIDQAVDRFLQHALFVADDDVRRAKLQKPLEAVVAVDHPAVQVVEVAGGETAAVQLHHRTQVRRDDWQHAQDHPLRAVVALAQAFHHAQTLGGFFLALLGARGTDFVPQFLSELLKFHVLENLVEGFSAHVGLEHLAILDAQLAVLRLSNELQRLEGLNLRAAFLRRGADLLEMAQRYVLVLFNAAGSI